MCDLRDPITRRYVHTSTAAEIRGRRLWKFGFAASTTSAVRDGLCPDFRSSQANLQGREITSDQRSALEHTFPRAFQQTLYCTRNEEPSSRAAARKGWSRGDSSCFTLPRATTNVVVVAVLARNNTKSTLVLKTNSSLPDTSSSARTEVQEQREEACFAYEFDLPRGYTGAIAAPQGHRRLRMQAKTVSAANLQN